MCLIKHKRDECCAKLDGKPPYVDSLGFRQASSPSDRGDLGHDQLRS
jgi:hypothetical protein